MGVPQHAGRLFDASAEGPRPDALAVFHGNNNNGAIVTLS